MDKTIRWVGAIPSGLKRFRFKKDAPKGTNLVALSFGLHGCCYVERDQFTGDLISTEGTVPVWDFYLFTPGHVMGLRDLETAKHTAWSQEWQESMHNKIQERLALPCRQ